MAGFPQGKSKCHAADRPRARESKSRKCTAHIRKDDHQCHQVEYDHRAARQTFQNKRQVHRDIYPYNCGQLPRIPINDRDQSAESSSLAFAIDTVNIILG